MSIPRDLSISYYELILTEDCNLRCTYCYDDFYSNRSFCHPNISMDVSTIPDLKKFIEKTHSKKEKIIFSFFGGEPVMNWNFITEFVKETENLPFKKEYIINTNGTMLNSEKIDYLVSKEIKTGISIDGKRESHDVNRTYKNKKGSWQDTMRIIPELIAKLKTKNIHANGLMVVTENNYKQLAENYIFLLDIHLIPNLLFNYDYEVTDEILQSIKDQLLFLFVEKNYPLPKVLNRILKNKNENTYCFSPQKSVSISPEGKLFFCHRMTPKMYQMGKDFKEYYGDIRKGYYRKEYYDLLKSRINFSEFKTSKECNSCVATKWCAGGCLATHVYFTKSYDKLNLNMCRIHILLDEIGKIIKTREGEIDGI
jgi:uncharacterized protein